MRLFQNIPNAEVVYVNAYALQTPRLSVFKSVAPNRGKNNRQQRDWAPIVPSAGTVMKSNLNLTEENFTGILTCDLIVIEGESRLFNLTI